MPGCVPTPANDVGVLANGMAKTFAIKPDGECPRAANRMVQRWNECLHCRRWYAAPTKELNQGKRIYCSLACTAAHAVVTGKFRGERNPRWLGGVSNDNMRYKRRSMERHPEKWAARRAVHNAVRSGRLVKQPCSSCGSARSNGHHEDYSKPLDVVWLCRSCHDAEHARLKSAK